MEISIEDRNEDSGLCRKKLEERVSAYERGYAEIDLDAVRSNMEAMAAAMDPRAFMMAMVKADAYGHGAVEIARAVSPYVRGYGVATIEEGLILRRHGIKKLILILGVTGKDRFPELVKEDIRPAIFQYEKAEALSDAAVSMGRKAKIHLAVDTGMSRIGMIPDEKAFQEALAISRLPGIEIEGIFTHFARADEADKKWVREQYEVFVSFIRKLEEAGVKIPMRHCSNSAGIIDLKDMELDGVRAGISIYGLYPSDEVDHLQISLSPAMSWKSFVSYLKTVPAGTPVSYGGTFVTDRPTRIATIPVGYGDGYSRNLSGKGEILIHGKRVPVLGRICMDQFMADVTDVDDVKEGDMVTLIGRDGGEEITAEEMAERSGGFHYEILCNVGKRMPRVYVEGGKNAAVKDYFDE
mgnify:FL=1